MKIAILGGGFAGLSAAYYLNLKGHDITLFEREQMLGGLAGGFKGEGWDWHLERTYHHLFSNDYDILNFAKEVGFDDIFFRSPETASLYSVNQNYRIFPVDTPQAFMKFPLLSLPVKLRAAIVLAFIKFSPFLTIYERYTAEEFLTKLQGKEAWNVLWEQLFRKKFGKYAENILASFFWARITKRTKDLGYPAGGFQVLINRTEKTLSERGVIIKKGVGAEKIIQKGETFHVGVGSSDPKTGERTSPLQFDAVISTLPTPIVTKLTTELFPDSYIKRLNKIKFLHAMNLILETKEPLLDKTYWLSICTADIPFMVAVQQTNYVEKEHYNGNHILYIGDYMDGDDKRLKMTKEEVIKLYSPHLKKTFVNRELSTVNSYLFKAGFAQPIFDKEFLSAKPDFETPVKNFFIANLDMTYPYDRGTNYAVKLGREVANLI